MSDSPVITRRTGPDFPRRVLLVGWDAADWQMIHPLVDQGLMPSLAGLMQRGSWGNLATTRPILSPILWNTIATGKRADQHGVLGFTEPEPDGPGVRPTASTSRRCKALWNILTQAGLRSHVVGWYASHPAEPIRGTMVSNQFEQCIAQDGSVRPVPAGSVHPADRVEELAEFRVHPGELGPEAILPFVPEAASVVARTGHRLDKVRHMLAQTATIHAVATHLISRDDWDFAAVYYEGIDRFGHEFMEFHPPRMPQVSQEDFQAYRHCMTGIYRFHDMLLDTLLQLAGPDTAVIVMSDHGYFNDHRRPDPATAGPVEWHRPLGMLAAAGQGIRAGGKLYGAGILDVTPTVLNLLGLPAARDMAGRVLAEAIQLDERPRIDSWELEPGDCGMHPPEYRVDPAEAQATLQQLIDLGYIQAPGPDQEKTRRDTLAGNQFQLAHSCADAGQYAKALELVESLDPSVRDACSGQLLMASCLLGLRDLDRAHAVLQSLRPEPGAVSQRELLAATVEFMQGRAASAIARVQDLATSEPDLAGVHVRLGEMLLDAGRHREALDALERALARDAESAQALAGLARAHLGLGQASQALDHGLRAAAIEHHAPAVHLIIGQAFGMLGEHQAAVEAMELCVVQAPAWRVAQEALVAAYRAAGRGGQADALQARIRNAG